MRLPNSAHESRPWRIREIVPDFTLEDVWALPVEGGAEDFESAARADGPLRPGPRRLPRRPAPSGISAIASAAGSTSAGSRPPADGGPDGAGKLPIPGTSETSLAGRLPDDLRGTVADVEFGSLPFVPLYRTDDEFAAEVSNQTVHGVMHLAWVEQGEDRYQGQMAVYVKPRGAFGKGIHGADQTVPLLDRLPGADAAGRADVGRARGVVEQLCLWPISARDRAVLGPVWGSVCGRFGGRFVSVGPFAGRFFGGRRFFWRRR